MKITTSYGTLLVNAETEIPLTLTNPMFNDQGSHSLPFTIPWCEENLKSLGNPDLVNRATRPVVELECSIDADILFETGLLSFEDFDPGNSIELSFTTREGMFWKWAKETELRNLNFPVEHNTYGAWEQRFNAAIDKKYPEEIFALFPVIVDFIEDGSYWPEYAGNKEMALHPFQQYRFLNPINMNSGTLFYIRERNQKYIKDVSPFLYVNAIIDFIFNTYGFRIEQNDLTTIDELNRLCILNNNTITCLNGYLDYTLLVPEITVIEFIEAIFSKFNCSLFVYPNTKSVKIICNDNSIQSLPVKSINARILNHYPNSFQINLIQEKMEYDYNKPSKFTIDEVVDFGDYLLETGTIPKGIKEETTWAYRANERDYVNYPEKVVYTKVWEMIYFYKWVEAPEDDPFNYWYSISIIGALNMNYEPKSSTLEIKEIKTEFTIPFVWAGSIGVWNFDDILNPYWDSVCCSLFCPEFIVPLNEYSVNPFKYKEYSNPNKFPLCAAIYRGKLYKIGPIPDIDVHAPYASPFPFDGKNNLLADQANVNDLTYPDTLSLISKGENSDIGEKDTLNTFFKHTETFYKSAEKLVIANFNQNDFLRFDFKDKCITEGVQYFVDKIEITITPFKTEVVSVEAMSAKIFTDS